MPSAPTPTAGKSPRVRGVLASRARHDRPAARPISGSRPITSSNRSATGCGPATRPARASSRRCWRSSRCSRRRCPRWASRSGRWSSSRPTMRWRRRRRAAAARPARRRVIICTPDKDLAQCVRGTRVVQMDRRGADDPRRSRRRREVRRAAGVDSRLSRAGRRLRGRLSRACRAGARSRRRRCSRGSATSKHPRRLARVGRERRAPGGAGGHAAPRARRALLFRDLATLRTDIPLFDRVDDLRWNGPTPGVRGAGRPARRRRHPAGPAATDADQKLRVLGFLGSSVLGKGSGVLRRWVA